jgi:hypothetical protein
MNKFSSLLFLVAILLPAIASAEFSGLVKQGVSTNYIIGSGNADKGELVYNDLFSRTLLNLSYNDWFLETWLGTGLQEEGGVQEVDYTLGNISTIGKLAITTTISWYDIGGPDNLGFGDTNGDILIPAIEVEYPITSVGTYLISDIEYFEVMGSEVNDGFFTTLGIKQHFTAGNTDIGVKYEIVRNGTYQIDDTSSIGQLEVKQPLTENVILSVTGDWYFLPDAEDQRSYTVDVRLLF